MALASKVGQIVFSQKSGVYMPAIQSNKGELFQEYQGSISDPVGIYPDFTTLQPTLSYVLISSRVSEGIVTPVKVDWYFNDTLITFTNGVSTNIFSGETGHFKQIDAGGGELYHGLQIIKNLVKASGGTATLIRAKATVLVGNVTDEIQFVYSIPITQATGNAKVVTIMAGDDKFFTITEKGGSCNLRAMVRVGADEITTGLTYKWYILRGGKWELLVGETSRDLTIYEGMIDTAGQVKLEAYQGGIMIGMDTQSVMDASDPFDILTNPNPEDETITGPNQQVEYSPWLVKRGSREKYRDMTFFFTFLDAAGNTLNVETSTTPSEKGSCTYDMCIQAGGNVSFVITTAE